MAGAALAQAAVEDAPSHWKLEYFYDRSQEELNLNDFQMVSAKFGIGVGWVTDKKGKHKPMALVSRDGGVKWEPQELPDTGISMFFLNDSAGWLVGEKSVWKTEEGGREWKKLSKIPKDSDINRVYFRDDQNGWAVCTNKVVLQTTDGGRSWIELEAAKKPNANPSYTSYNWIEFVSPKQGIIVGSSVPPRPGAERPVWLDPEAASKRREWPSLTITLETADGGATWTPQTAPAFGQTVRFRRSSDGRSLVLIRFGNAFEWPSEVYMVKPGGGAGTRVYREKDRVVTDCGWLSPSRAVLAAVEPPGRVPQLPVPGKVHVLISEDLAKWTEMKVDYRAFASKVMFSSINAESAWLATDTGQILRLTK